MRRPELVLFCLSAMLAHGQMDRGKEDWMFETTTNFISIPDFGNKVAYGMQAEYMVTRHIGFQMSAVASKDYVAFNGPALLVPIGILIADKKSSARDVISLIQLIFWASVIENPAFHFRLNKRVELVPYASLCRVRYWWNSPEPFASSWIASGSVGFKVGYFFAENWFINFSAEHTRLYYSGKPDGFQLAISLGKVKD